MAGRREKRDRERGRFWGRCVSDAQTSGQMGKGRRRKRPHVIVKAIQSKFSRPTSLSVSFCLRVSLSLSVSSPSHCSPGCPPVLLSSLLFLLVPKAASPPERSRTRYDVMRVQESKSNSSEMMSVRAKGPALFPTLKEKS